VQHEADAGLGRLQPAIEAVAQLDLRRPDLGDALPATPAGYAGVVVLGGSMGATDDDVAPWLPATRRLLAAAVEAALPTLGLCLGAQLLAVATGGSSAAPTGWRSASSRSRWPRPPATTRCSARSWPAAGRSPPCRSTTRTP